MGLVFLFAIAYTPVLLLIEPYRKEWLGEQRAIAEIRARGHHVGFTTVKVGPQWLQKLSWGHRHYFERVRNLYFVSGGWEDYLDRRSAFHHVGMVFQD
jgi:hypothetical protein